MKFDPAEMAMILEQVRQEAKKIRPAHTEVKTLINDGTSPGKDFFGNGNLYAKVSDEPIDLSTVIDISITENETTTTLPHNSFLYEGNEYSHMLYFNSGSGVINENSLMLFSAFVDDEGDGVQKGTYALSLDAQNGISKIRYEAIHPIPQECIPPLDRLILNGADGNQYALTITDGAISVAPVTT